MLTPDQEKLKEAALAVWESGWTTDGATVFAPDGDSVCFCTTDLGHQPEAVWAEERAAFIAAANPAAILAILAQLELVQGDADVSYELIQDDMAVAGTSGPGALREIQHYAALYSQDGPVEIVEVTRRKLPPPTEAA